MSAAAPSRAREVNVVQALGLLLAFVLVAALGGVLVAGLVMPAVAGTSVAASTATTVFDDLPAELQEEELAQRSVVYDKSGRVLATFFEENRIIVPLADIAPILQKAVIASEDKRFYAHGGVDITGTVRALAVNLAGGDQGGSTLTQQYVKNVLIEQANRNNDRVAIEAARIAKGAEGYQRKLREAKLAIALEKKYTKDEILERYLNIAQFGASVYGIEAAAQYYFNTSAKEVDYLQAATLAGVTQSPSKWDPERNPELSKDRRDTVLQLMREQGYITQEQHDKGVATPIEDTLDIQKTKLGCTSAGISGFFCDYVNKVIANDPAFGETKADRRNLLLRGGLEIHTTLDRKLQKLADEKVRASIPRKDPSRVAHALVTVQPGTGKILAMAQNRAYSSSKDTEKWETAVNYNTDKAYGGSSGFQPGSTFKPFTLVAWLQARNGLNQVVDATRREFEPRDWQVGDCDGGTGDKWHPRNSDGGGSGPVTVMRATAHSINTAFAAMASQIDLCTIFEAAESLGVHKAIGGDLDRFPANILGTNEVSPLSMAASYAAFAAEGEYCEPIAITKVVRPDGTEMPVPAANCRQAIGKDVANAVTFALKRVLTEGSAAAVGGLPGRESAGKTGTTNDNVAAWFVGYTPQLSTAVWMGYSEGNKKMQNMTIGKYTRSNFYGGTISAPTWKAFMVEAHKGYKVRAFGGFGNQLLTGPMATVPDVIGRTESEARSILGRAGFSVRYKVDEQYSDSVPQGRVMSTSPGAGSRVSKGTAVQLVISKGRDPISTPDGRCDARKPEDRKADPDCRQEDKEREREKKEKERERDDRERGRSSGSSSSGYVDPASLPGHVSGRPLTEEQD